jgi:hypothetical protein
MCEEAKVLSRTAEPQKRRSNVFYILLLLTNLKYFSANPRRQMT